MKVLRVAVLVLAVALCVPVVLAQDPAEVWKAISKPDSDGARVATVTNLVLQRDRIRITLASGTIAFMQPAGQAVFGAVFVGRGRAQAEPPNPNEMGQLRLFTGKDALDMEFTQAVFVFTDGTFEEVARQVQWADVSSPGAALYLDRQQDREDKAAELLPRLLKNLLAADKKRNAFFAADLDTRDKGWIHIRHDALEIEEVFVGKWERRGPFFALQPWMSFPAGGAGSPAYGEPLLREDFLVRSYDLNVTAGEDEMLAVTARVDIQHRATGERVALFALDANLRVASVKDAQGNPLTFFQPRDPVRRDQSYGDYVAVILPQPSSAGASQSIEFQYSGKRVIRRVGQGNYFCQSFGWYPAARNAFAARSDFQMTFRYPARFSLVATGSKVSDEPYKPAGAPPAGQWNTSTWKSDMPLAVAGFAFGNYKTHTEKVGGVFVDIYANKDPDDNIQSMLNYLDDPIPGRRVEVEGANIGTMVPAAYVKPMGVELANSIAAFEKYFGPYPYKRLAMTNIPYTYGQGWPGLIYLSFLSFLDSTQRNSLGLKDHAWLSDYWRAHEASHQWWGHRVGWKTYRDQWLSEGFATFSGNLYVHLRNQMKDYLVRIRKDKEDYCVKTKKAASTNPSGPSRWVSASALQSRKAGTALSSIARAGSCFICFA